MEYPDAYLEIEDLDEVLNALGPASAVAYAPPNIYPMSAPRFQPAATEPRPHPQGNKLGIYIHIPFCNYHCTFCFYATRLTPSVEEIQRYVRALETELLWIKPGTQLTQLYCGGGTPTALPAELLDQVLTNVFARLSDGHQNVHTVECSPESLTKAHVDVLRKHSIERVSMGVQSLQDRVLTAVKREHLADRVFQSCDLLVSAGLMVNVDLIYGLPGQTEASFCDDFTTLAQRGIHSFTAYNLRVNERTPVGRNLDDDERLDIRRLVRWRSLVKAHARQLGFRPTRWHTFQCLTPATATDIVRRFADHTGHGEQFGIGVSARSRLCQTVYRNHARYDEYLNRIERDESPVEESFPLNDADRQVRFVGLTLGDGYPLRRETYLQELGHELDEDYFELLQVLEKVGLIDDDGQQITLTAKGQLLYDLVTRAFYPQHVRHWLDQRQPLAQASANIRSRPTRARKR